MAKLPLMISSTGIGCRIDSSRIGVVLRRSLVIMCSAALPFLIFILLSPLTSQAADPFVGKITSIDSGPALQELSIIRVGKNGFAKAKLGDPVFVGDTIKTGRDVKAQIELSDQSIVYIGPQSIFRVKGYAVTPAESKRIYSLKALKGILRFLISKSYRAPSSGSTLVWGDSNITVESATAIAGVRGTDFVVAVLESEGVPATEISVLEGVVTVRNMSVSIRENVILTANQVSKVQRGAKPSVPTDLLREQRDTLLRKTMPAASGRESNNEVPGKSAPYGKADMERDLAAGVSLPEVFDRSSNAGMKTDEILAAALAAGVEPYTAVYTAIVEGYPAQVVVNSAISNGALLTEVVSAALMAGGEKKQIVSGATSAGAPPAAIASSVAVASSSVSPVYGYSLAANANPTVNSVIPAAPVLVSGGGGATPSTQPASPYRP